MTRQQYNPADPELDLSGMSAAGLEALARRANRLAEDLRKEEPTYALALANGVRDTGYHTVRYGRVPSFSGEALITMEDGRQWRAIGHRPRGDAETVTKNGWIEFVPVNQPESNMKFYGTDSETIVKTDSGIYLIQSVDFYEEGQYEELKEIPDGFEELDPALCTDLIIPEDCK